MAASQGPRDVHDRLVKRVYSRKAAFAVELRRVLPRELLRGLDLHTLAKHPTERIDERLRGRISDLCFTADLVGDERRRPAFFPLEHCSTSASLLPLRAMTCAAGLWHEHLADHPDATVLPLVVPIVLVQPSARHVTDRLSTILDVPPRVRATFPSPIEVRMYIDDLSGSVLDDPVADRVTLALVELARAFLHAHGNPASLTKERLDELVPLFDVLLAQREPLATHDLRVLLTYVLTAFEEGSPVRALVERAIRGRPRAMFVSIADSLVAQGRRAGLSEGRKVGLSEGRRAGLARAVLRLLEHRSVSVPRPVRKRVSSSLDERELLRWLDRAVTASSAEELFDELDGRDG